MYRFSVTTPAFHVVQQASAALAPPPQAPNTPQPPVSSQAGPYQSSAGSRARLLNAVQRRDSSLFSHFRIACAIPRDLESKLRQARPLVTARSIVSEIQRTGVAGPVIDQSVVRSFGLPQGLKYRFVEKMMNNRRITLLFGYNEQRKEVHVMKWTEINEQERLSIAKRGSAGRNGAASRRAGLKQHQEALVISTAVDNKPVDVLFIRNIISGCVEKVMLPAEIISRVFPQQQSAALAAHIRGLNTRRRLDGEIGKRTSIVDIVALCAEKEMSPQTALIGIPDVADDGSATTRLVLDDMLNACLSTPESSPLVHRILQGQVDRNERLELLQGIVERYRPEAGSRPALLLRQAIDDIRRDAASYSDRVELLALLHSAGWELRSRARELASVEFRAVLVNTLHEYKPPLQSKARQRIRRMVEWLESHHGQEITGRQMQRAVHGISSDLAQLGAINGKRPDAGSTALREAPRMPTDCLAHWLTVLDDVISGFEHRGAAQEAQEIQTLRAQAEAYWLAQDLPIGRTRNFFTTAAERCARGGWENLAEFSKTLASQLPAPNKEEFAANATRLLDNPYGRAYDVFLVHSAIKSPHEGMLRSVHELGRWLWTELFPDPANRTELDRECIRSLQLNVQAKRWHWLPGSPALTAFADAATTSDAEAILQRYLLAPKISGLDCIAISYLVSRFAVHMPRKPDWLNESNHYYSTILMARRTRLDAIESAVNDYTEYAQDLFDAGLVDPDEYDDMLNHADEFREVGYEKMRRTHHAGTTLLHHPAAVQEQWMSASVRPINHFRPDFSVLQHAGDGDDGSLSGALGVERMAERFAKIERNGRFAGDESGVTNLVMFATAAARRAGFQIDADAIWKATAMLTTYNGGHQPEECYTVAKQLNSHLNLGIGGSNQLPENEEFSYHSFFTGNGSVDTEYWTARTREAFDELRAYFKRISVYGDIGVTEPARTTGQQSEPSS